MGSWKSGAAMRWVRNAVVVIAAGLAGAAVHAQAPAIDAPGEVYRALEAGRYAEVEAYHARLHRERTRKPDGEFLFEDLAFKVYWYSTHQPDDPAYWPKVDAATRAWVTHSPGSHLAAMTRAFALAYRGETVRARGGLWQEFQPLAGEARRLLEGSRKQGQQDALWHAIGLRVAGLEDRPRADILAWVEAGVAADPHPVRLYQEAAFALTPGSRSNVDDLRWLMQLAEQRTASEPGSGIAARVLAQTFWQFPEFMTRPFAGKGPRWDEVHRSFTDWARRPGAGYPVDLHAALACAARDRDVASRLMPRAGLAAGHADTWGRFGGPNLFARCKEWAVTASPTV
ncbi:MAG TPA: hypothetical protein VIL30_18680 [Ramlibacter sp.]